MCAQSLIAAPLLPPMSSSAAPLGHRNQAYLRDHQYWDPFTTHTPTSGPVPNSIQHRQPVQGPYNGYMARWIADTAVQNSRARSVPAVQLQESSGTLGQRYDESKSLHGLDSSLDRLAIQPQSSWPPVDRVHRSMSPEMASKQNGMARRNSVDTAAEQIASYLQIPSSINSSKGSLADLASQVSADHVWMQLSEHMRRRRLTFLQITCLFWFEDVSVLKKVEDAIGSPHVTALSHEATPTIGFRKWVTTLLSTTQVSQNVVLLALLFIYRLKKITLNVQGKVGSEYRLLTVALMLGNKFLDDNTYTNKTWADVSGISVSEIHVMEVEFLSNMKYNLFTSAEHWSSWHVLLGKYSDYFEKASRLYPISPAPGGAPNITAASVGQPVLPFTPPSEQVSPPTMASQHMPVPRQLPNPMATFMASGLPPTAHRLPEAEMRPTELRAAGSRPVSRKRSYDLTNWEPPQKVARTSGLGQELTSTLSSGPDQSMLRLPMPANSISSAYQHAPHSNPVQPLTASQLTLPAPAMMTPESMWQPPSNPVQQSLGTNMPPLPALFTQTQTPPAFQAFPRSDPHDISPTNTSFNATPQQTQSPSGYLLYRNSPYRPVRQVNTLLAPPPSASLNNPMQHMSQQHTYYQPLSKGPMEPRQGMVPYLTPRQFQMTPMFDSSRQVPPFDFRQLFGQR